MEGKSNKKSKKIHKRKFTDEEDNLIKKIVFEKGEHCWKLISEIITYRTPRQIRERWKHYLSPNVKIKEWTDEEDKILIEQYNYLGPRWTKIKEKIPEHTSVNIKNRYSLLVRRGYKNTQKSQSDDKKTDFSEDSFGDIINSNIEPKIKNEYNDDHDLKFEFSDLNNNTKSSESDTVSLFDTD